MTHFSNTKLFLVSIFCLLTTKVFAQDIETEQLKKVVATDRAASDKFSCSVAVDGDYAIVGAYDEDEDASNSNTLSSAGSAYILKRDSSGVWSILTKLVASDRESPDYFGWSVDINGDYAIVGAPYEFHDTTGANSLAFAGSAYIFKKDQGGTDNWGQLRKLVASDRASSDQFGYSVAIDEGQFYTYAVVGAPYKQSGTGDADILASAGAVYVFKSSEGGTDKFGQIKKVESSDIDASDNLGFSVSVSGNYLVAGAPNEDEDTAQANTMSAAGSAYVFKRNQGGTDNWGQLVKLVPSDRSASDNFGYDVSINSSYVIVGAPLQDTGHAYIFEKSQGGTDNWGELKILYSSDGAASDNFGYSVDITTSYALVGARYEDEDYNSSNTLSSAGSAYVYSVNQGGTDNWGQLRKLTPSDRNSNDNLGYAVSLSGEYMLVGAMNSDFNESDSDSLSSAGSVYFFKVGNAVRTTTGDYTVTTNCTEMSGTQWYHLTDTDGNIIISINPNGNNLGAICWGVRVVSTGNDREIIVTGGDTGIVLDRNYYFNPTNTGPYTGNILVRYYFTQDELDSFMTHRNSSVNVSNFTRLQYLNDSIKTTVYDGSNRTLDLTDNDSASLASLGSSQTKSTLIDNSIRVLYFETSKLNEVIPGMVFSNTSTPLPIELVKFNASANNGNVYLNWITASEHNNNYFEVLRSKDGAKWEAIGVVKGAGSSSTINKYNLVDIHPYYGTSYYRLKQVDYNGDFSYSKIGAVNINALGNISYYPNPADKQITVTAKNISSVKIYTTTGILVNVKISLNENGAMLDLTNIKDGIYILVVSNGVENEAVKISVLH